MTFGNSCKGLLSIVALGLLAGCPPAPVLSVSPAAITFGSNGVTRDLTISNTGGGALNWSIEEVTRPNPEAPWIAEDVPWLSIETTSGQTTNETDRVQLNADRAGQPVGLLNNSGIRINSNGGSVVVPVSMQIEPTVFANPTMVALAPTATSGEFSVFNTGATSANWELRFLPNPEDTSVTLPIPAAILVEPNPGSTPAGSSTLVRVSFPQGQEDFALLLQSAGGNSVIQFNFGSILQGLEVTPPTLTLFVASTEETENPTEEVPSTITVRNTSGTSRNWVIDIVDRTNPSSTPPIAVSPDNSTTAAGQVTPVEVRVTDATQIRTGAGNYELILTSGDSFLIVPIIIEIMSLPIVTLSEPPDPEVARPEITEIDVLDFGREEVQAEFYIANTGPRGSDLSFRITYEGQNTESSLIASVEPLEGDTNGPEGVFFYPPSENRMIDAQRVLVTIDRSQLVENVEFHTITVTAWDADFQAPISAVEPATLQVRVERQPLQVEGAINRSRPPYVMRFVFLLRDSLSRVIPTQTEAQRERLDFQISENDIPLDLNETNLFLNGPENLRVNLVLLLDYTGSMLNAGTTGPNPIPRGEAIRQVKEAAKEFIDDLPPSYRIALMFHRDRQQSNRLIHNFSTDKASLKAALDAFTLPAALHGVTAINDALVDAVNRIAAEDSGETLPFDDADVRAVVYITDGRDNASAANAGEVGELADETRTRLYPVIYAAGSQTSPAESIVLATESGGHLYNAGPVTNLRRILGNEGGLALDPVEPQGGNQVQFEVRNVGTGALDWTIDQGEAPWITSVTPSGGSLQPGATARVTVRLNPAVIGANANDATTLTINSNNGTGTAEIALRVAADGLNAESITIDLTDVPGTIWNELQNQLVLTYITPAQVGGSYNVAVSYQEPGAPRISGFFEDDGVFFPGDVRAGQVSMSTNGIFELPGIANPDEAIRAEVYVRADYVPRGVNRFRMRFMVLPPADIPPAAAAALAQAQLRVELAPEGLLIARDEFSQDWRLLNEGDNSYVLLTDQDNTLPYGAFGNLLKITVTNIDEYVDAFSGVPRQPEFLLDMRVDNQIYVTPGSVGETNFFLYPSGPTNPDRPLVVTTSTDVASPARSVLDLSAPGINPNAPRAWDRDEDGLPDYNDPLPDSESLPGPLTVPNPLEIEPDVAVSSVLIRNNRLDTFTWNLDEASLPSWIDRVTYGTPVPGPGDPGPAPQSTLAPGQQEQINLHLDRSGLTPGFYPATLVIETDRFGTEDLPVTLIVTAP